MPGDGQPTTKFDPQLVNDFEGMEPGCYHETFIDEEVDYAEAIRVSVELEMQVPENPYKARSLLVRGGYADRNRGESPSRGRGFVRTN